jgi:hypothetical protein
MLVSAQPSQSDIPRQVVFARSPGLYVDLMMPDEELARLVTCLCSKHGRVVSAKIERRYHTYAIVEMEDRAAAMGLRYELGDSFSGSFVTFVLRQRSELEEVTAPVS